MIWSLIWRRRWASPIAGMECFGKQKNLWFPIAHDAKSLILIKVLIFFSFLFFFVSCSLRLRLRSRCLTDGWNKELTLHILHFTLLLSLTHSLLRFNAVWLMSFFTSSILCFIFLQLTLSFAYFLCYCCFCCCCCSLYWFVGWLRRKKKNQNPSDRIRVLDNIPRFVVVFRLSFELYSISTSERFQRNVLSFQYCPDHSPNLRRKTQKNIESSSFLSLTFWLIFNLIKKKSSRERWRKNKTRKDSVNSLECLFFHLFFMRCPFWVVVERD